MKHIMSCKRSIGFTLTDKELDALQDALRAKATAGDSYKPCYADAAHMIHEARMEANSRRAERLRTKLRERRQLGI